MKNKFKHYFIISALFFNSFLFSQNNKIGKVIIEKYINSNDKVIQSITDSELEFLNKREHDIIIRNDSDSVSLKSDKNGLFKIPKKYFDSCSIVVNNNFKELREEFVFIDSFKESDTIELKISDFHISNKIDSTKSPNFYVKYNIFQAEKDFLNKKRRYLMIVSSSYSPKFLKEIDSKSKKYEFEIEYLEDIKGTLSELRIIYRYNKRMFELLGIKD